MPSCHGDSAHLSAHGCGSPPPTGSLWGLVGHPGCLLVTPATWVAAAGVTRRLESGNVGAGGLAGGHGSEPCSAPGTQQLVNPGKPLCPLWLAHLVMVELTHASASLISLKVEMGFTHCCHCPIKPSVSPPFSPPGSLCRQPVPRSLTLHFWGLWPPSTFPHSLGLEGGNQTAAPPL